MRICFIGDSFVNGTGDDDCLGWPGRLCAQARRRGHDVTLYNLGIRRDTSADIAARWEHEATARLPPDQDCRLVFSFGVNDCVNDCVNGPPARPRVTEEASIVNASTILSRARSLWPTLMIGPPCTDDAALDRRVARLSERLGRLCGALPSLPYLPLFALTQGNAAWRREAAEGDGIHPNREGYALIAGAVMAWPAWQAWL